MRINVCDLLDVGTLVVLVFGFYLLIFMPMPFNWYHDLVLDFRYLPVYLLYCLGLLLSLFIVRSGKLKLAVTDPREASFRVGRYGNWVLIFGSIIGLVCALLTLIKIGEIPVLASGSNELRGAGTLGGFVDYQVDVLTVVSLVWFLRGGGFKFNRWNLMGLLCILPAVLLQSRQELVFLLLWLVAFNYINSSLSLSSVLRQAALIFVFAWILIFALGQWYIYRVGLGVLQPYETSNLAMYVAIGDVTNATKLAHLIADQLGPAELNFRYTIPVYVSVFYPNIEQLIGAHGAVYIQQVYTNAVTAQSVAAPLSFFLDGGYLYVLVAGLITGCILRWYRWKASQRGQIKHNIVVITFFLWCVWTIRSGSLPFFPIWIFQMLFIYAVFPGRYASVARLLYIPAACLGLAMAFVRF